MSHVSCLGGRSSWFVSIAALLALAAPGCGGSATTNGAGGGGGTQTTSQTGSSSGTTTTTNEGGSGGGMTTTTSSTSSTTTTATGGSGGGAPHTFLDKYPLDAQFPEGGTYDSVAHAFYVGSLGDGSVHRIDATTGAETVMFTETLPGTWWTLGMDVDLVKRRLWVCAMDDKSPDPREGHIWIFDLVTGKRIANHALGDAALDATCTDVAVTKGGLGYVVDREMGNLYRVDPLTGATLFTSSTDLEAAVIGQNSIVVLPDESALLSLLYLPSALARVDLLDGSVTQVDITGKFSDLTPLHGADGMTYDNGSVVVAFTEKLIRVTPTVADWSLATSVAVDIPNGMTDVISTPNGLYLLNGQSLSFAFGTSTDPFALVKFVGAL